MASVTLRSVTKSYDQTNVLRDINLDIEDGEFVTLLGPSGCGKSTLLKIIAGLDRQTDGDVVIGGRPVFHERPAARNVAMVFQSYALYPHMTAYQNMALPLAMRTLSLVERLPFIGRLVPGTTARRKAMRQRIVEAARMLGIEALLDRRPAQLSGGQKQRIAVGRALVRHPDVFLLDEPLSNLDAKLRHQMRDEIVAVHRRAGVTSIYVTHDQAEAMTMADRVALMMDGVLQQVATPREIYTNPANLNVATFVGSPPINLIDARYDSGDGLLLGETRLALPQPPAQAGAMTAGLRPEALILLPPDQPGWFQATVRRVEYLGADLIVTVKADGVASDLVARVSPETEIQIEPGRPVGISADPGALLFFDANGDRIGRDSRSEHRHARG